MKFSPSSTAAAVSISGQLMRRLPFWPQMEKNISRYGEAWSKSRFIKHPYVQLERGFVFIHVPKSAGTSLNQAFGLNAPLNSALHSKARDLMPLLRRLDPEVKSISFVRNPYARFVSLYQFARLKESLYCSALDPKRAPCGKHPDHDLLSNQSMEQCAELLIQGKLSGGGWNPQIDWLTDQEGHKGKLMVDFLGRVESLEIDLLRLQQMYGITAGPLPWLNKSCNGRKGPPEWTDRTRDLVRLYYKRDFELLGYEE